MGFSPSLLAKLCLEALSPLRDLRAGERKFQLDSSPSFYFEGGLSHPLVHATM